MSLSMEIWLRSLRDISVLITEVSNTLIIMLLSPSTDFLLKNSNTVLASLVTQYFRKRFAIAFSKELIGKASIKVRIDCSSQSPDIDQIRMMVCIPFSFSALTAYWLLQFCIHCYCHLSKSRKPFFKNI